MTTYIVFLIGTVFGIYIGSKTFRTTVHTLIDKYIFKKNTKATHAPKEAPTKSDNYLIVNGIKYTKDDNGGNT